MNVLSSQFSKHDSILLWQISVSLSCINTSQERAWKQSLRKQNKKKPYLIFGHEVKLVWGSISTKQCYMLLSGPHNNLLRAYDSFHYTDGKRSPEKLGYGDVGGKTRARTWTLWVSILGILPPGESKDTSIPSSIHQLIKLKWLQFLLCPLLDALNLFIQGGIRNYHSQSSYYLSGTLPLCKYCLTQHFEVDPYIWISEKEKKSLVLVGQVT